MLSYFSPELFRQGKRLSSGCVFSLGMLILALVLGREVSIKMRA